MRRAAVEHAGGSALTFYSLAATRDSMRSSAERLLPEKEPLREHEQSLVIFEQQRSMPIHSQNSLLYLTVCVESGGGVGGPGR